MKRFALAEPGDGVAGGLFQGIALGYPFYYKGPGSHLPAKEIKFFDSYERAVAARDEIRSLATPHTPLAKLNIIQAVEIDDTTDIDAVALFWYSAPSIPDSTAAVN